MQDNKHTFLPLLGRHLISIKLDVFQVGIKSLRVHLDPPINKGNIWLLSQAAGVSVCCEDGTLP